MTFLKLPRSWTHLALVYFGLAVLSVVVLMGVVATTGLPVPLRLIGLAPYVANIAWVTVGSVHLLRNRRGAASSWSLLLIAGAWLGFLLFLVLASQKVFGAFWAGPPVFGGLVALPYATYLALSARLARNRNPRSTQPPEDEGRGVIGTSKKGRTFTKARGFTAVELIKYADGHLKSARILFASPAFGCLDSAGYLGHLSIELLLKSGILHLSDAFPNEHDLAKLRADLATMGTQLSLTGDEEAALYIFGQFTELRYPDPQEPIGIGTADGEALYTLVNAILRQLPPALIQELSIANFGEKGGRVLMTRRVGGSESVSAAPPSAT